eukprot:13882721-Alexandrium_andersonii.AAC.1
MDHGTATPKHLAAIEYNKEAQRELLNMPQRCRYEHVYGNIEEFFTDAVKQKLGDMKKRGVKMTLHTFMPLIKSLKSVQDSARCAACDATCKFPNGNFHHASTSCVNFSAMGDNSGTSGETMSDFAAWAAQRLMYPACALISTDAHCSKTTNANQHTARSTLTFQILRLV